MPISLALRGPLAEGPRADQAWAGVLGHLRMVDSIFSTYRPDSPISRLRRGAISLADCPALVHEVLALAERARAESDGAFDIYRPGPSGTRELDPSGVVKGWAVTGAAPYLEALDDTDYCLSAGGDMVCRTRGGGSEPWQIGVEDPHDPHRVLARIPVLNGAVATSGLAHRGAHIIDPRTGLVPTRLASVTVVAPDLTWADIDATTAFVLGERARGWLEGRDRTGLIVTSTGEITVLGAPTHGS